MSKGVNINRRYKSLEASRAPFFTVFTPAYNRGDLLNRVYQSLLRQTFADFEWVIVDDGSTDETKEIVHRWISEQPPFAVRYHYQENGGKHAAHNAALAFARGFALVIVDSDDWLRPTGLEIMKSAWDKLSDPDRFVGVCGLFEYANGAVVGERFPQDWLISNPVDLRYNLRVEGDKFGFSRLDVLKAYPFPQQTGREYVPESVVWNRIGQRYDTVFINQVIAVKEYQPSGITDRSALNSFRNPGAYYVCGAEVLNGRISIRASSAVRCLITVLKCAFYTRRNPFVARRALHRVMSVVLIPVACLAVVRDLVRLRRERRGEGMIQRGEIQGAAPGSSNPSCRPL